MSKSDIIVYKTIQDIEGKIECSAGYDPRDKTYYMVSLTFKEGHTLGSDTWDSDTYIFETFYPFLKRFTERTLTVEDKKEFPLWEKLTEEEVLNLIDVLNQAIEFGWNKLEL